MNQGQRMNICKWITWFHQFSFLLTPVWSTKYEQKYLLTTWAACLKNIGTDINQTVVFYNIGLKLFGWTACNLTTTYFRFVVSLTNRLRNIIAKLSYRNWIKSGCISHLPKNSRLINFVYEYAMDFAVAVGISNRLSSILSPLLHWKGLIRGFQGTYGIILKYHAQVSNVAVFCSTL